MTILITTSIFIGVAVVGFIWLGLSLRKKDRERLQKEMSSWLEGDIVTLVKTSRIWKDIQASNFYYESHEDLILVRWSLTFIEIQTIDGQNYFIDINNVLENVSARQRKLAAEMEAFVKTEEERKTLNPDTLYNDISIYTMNREQLQKTLESSQEDENYELCEKIKNLIEDKYAES